MIYVSTPKSGLARLPISRSPCEISEKPDIAGGAVEAASWPTVVTDKLAGRGLNRAYPLESTWT
jgi:hypothetical protein